MITKPSSTINDPVPGVDADDGLASTFLKAAKNSFSEKMEVFPQHPSGKIGWPWTADEARSERSTSPKALPTISIVVVSFNQAAYLEEALRSLLLQEYPHLEIVVADGGSRDGSVETIRRYEPWLAAWFSEPDRGQSHALNKAFTKVTGEICNWLCSDDLLLPGALHHVGQFFRDHASVDVLAGSCRYQNEAEPTMSYNASVNEAMFSELPARNPVLQPGCYFRRSMLQSAGPLREDLHYTMDWELWCRFVRKEARWAFTKQAIGVYRLTGSNKAFVGGGKILREVEGIYLEYAVEGLSMIYWFRYLWLPLMRHWHRRQGNISGRAASFAARNLLRVLRRTYESCRCENLRTQYWLYGIEQESTVSVDR